MSIQIEPTYETTRRAWSMRFAVLVVAGLFSSTVGALDVGSLPPEVGPKDLAGRPVSLEGLRGKVVLVDFWASWCACGRGELPVLETLYRKYRSAGLEVVAVNEDKDADSAQSFLRHHAITFALVHDKHFAIAKRYAPTKMPSSYLIDRAGVLRYVHSGFKSGDMSTLEAAIKRLLGNK